MKKKCKKCKYEWESRVPNPKECPACKHRDWDKKDSRKRKKAVQ